eukprot:766619-Hanusia_phi.AAC.3
MEQILALVHHLHNELLSSWVQQMLIRQLGNGSWRPAGTTAGEELGGDRWEVARAAEEGSWEPAVTDRWLACRC